MLLERDIEIRFNVALSVVYRRGLVYFFLYAWRSSGTYALRRPARKRRLPCEVYAQKFQSVHGIRKELGVRLEFSFYGPGLWILALVIHTGRYTNVYCPFINTSACTSKSDM